MSVFASLMRGRVIWVSLFLIVVLFVNSAATSVPVDEGNGLNPLALNDLEPNQQDEDETVEPEPETPPMSYQPPVNANSLADFAPADVVVVQIDDEEPETPNAAEFSSNLSTNSVADGSEVTSNLSTIDTVDSDGKSAIPVINDQNMFIMSGDDLAFLVEKDTFDEGVNFEFVEKQEKLAVDSEALSSEEGRLDGVELIQEFGVEVINPTSGEVHHQFDQPVRIVFDLRDQQIDLEEDGGTFFVAYRNPANPSELIDVPITTYDESGLIAAEVTHFSEWATGWRPEGWSLHWDLPTVSGFDGAANYRYPIEVPPGRGGMQPNIDLMYSSSALNGVMKELPNGTIAAGWSMSEIAIVRTGVEPSGGFFDKVNKPQEYRLVLNGAGYELVKDVRETFTETEAVFAVKNNPSIRVTRYGNDNMNGVRPNTAEPISWIVQTSDGKSYRLGHTAEAKTITVLRCKCENSNTTSVDNQRFESEWHVDLATDAFGNFIYYDRENSEETGSTTISTSTLRKHGSLIKSIYYNFKTKKGSYPYAGPFGDVLVSDSELNNASTQISFNYSGAQLNSIEVFHGRQNKNFALKKYELSVENRSIENKCVRKRITDQNGDKEILKRITSTKVLYAIQESSQVENNGWDSLPLVRMEYLVLSNFGEQNEPYTEEAGDIWVNGTCFQYYRLRSVENGYGAAVTFDYESDDRDSQTGIGRYRANESGTIENPKSANSWYVTGMSVNDGVGHATYTKFTRTGRCYIQKNTGDQCSYTGDEYQSESEDNRPEYGILAGFGQVVQEHLEDGNGATLSKTVTTYNTGNDGFGQPDVVKSYARNGKIYQQVETEYHDFTLFNNHTHKVRLKFRPVESVLTTRYGPDGTALPTRVSYQYETTYGHMTHEKTYIGAGALNPSTDNIQQEVAYDYSGLYKTNGNFWWVSRLKETTVKDRFKDVISKTEYSYAADSKDYTAPTQVTVNGLITSKTRFDDYGNVKLIYDANNNKTTLSYETGYYLYPIQAEAANGQKTQFKVYGFNGSNTNQPPGLLEKVIDPNSLETRYKYDEHGRLTHTYLPNNSTDWASQITYEDDKIPFQIKTETIDGVTPAVVQYYDGLGRAIMTNQLAVPTNSGTHDLLTLVGYDEMGQVERQTSPLQITPSSLGDRFYSYKGGESFKLAGFRDSFPGSSLNTDEWILDTTNYEVKLDRLGVHTGNVQRDLPATNSQSGTFVSTFDFKIKTGKVGDGKVNVGLRTGTYNSDSYRKFVIEIPVSEGEPIPIQAVKQVGRNTPEVNSLIDLEKVSENNEGDIFSSWYQAEFTRNASTGYLHVKVTQKDNPSVWAAAAWNSDSAFSNPPNWNIIFQSSGAASVFVDNYTEYITGTSDSIEPAGTTNVYEYSKGDDDLVAPGDMQTIAPDGESESEVTNTIEILDENVDIYKTMVTQTMVDVESNKIQHFTNVLGQLSLVREYDDDGVYSNTEYHYDTRGNLDEVIRKDGNGTTLTTSTMTYDSLGRKTAMDDPDMGIWSYAYDNNGNLIQQIDAKGNKLCFWYDKLNRMVEKRLNATCASPTAQNPAPAENGTWLANYEYDTASKGKGKLSKVFWGLESNKDYETFSYDSFGRLNIHTRNINDQNFAMAYSDYDELNRPQTVTYPDGEKVKTTFDEMGPDTLKVEQSGTVNLVTDVTHNAFGQITVIERAGQTHNPDTTYVYHGADKNFRLHKVEHGGNGQSDSDPADYIYTYYKSGNIHTLTETGAGNGTITFNYDHLYRLETAIADFGGYDEKRYSYDELGNFKFNDEREFGYGQPVGVAAGAKPHAVTHIDGVQKYWYDQNGNMTVRIENVAAGSIRYDQVFDEENRLVEVKKNNLNSQITKFAYDPSGQRTWTEDPDGTITYFPFPNYEEIHELVIVSTPIPPTPIPPTPTIVPPTATSTSVLPTSTPVLPTVTPTIEVEETPVAGDTYYVSTEGPSNGDGQTWATAWNELNKINWSVLEGGDVVYIDGGTDKMRYTTQIKPAKSGGNGNPIILRLAYEAGRNGQIEIFGGNSVPLPECGQLTWDESEHQQAGDKGVYFEEGISNIMIDGRKRHGIVIHGWNNNGIVFEPDRSNNNVDNNPKNVTLQYIEIYNNGGILRGGQDRKDADVPYKNKDIDGTETGIVKNLYYPHHFDAGIELAGTGHRFHHLEIHDNAADAIQSVYYSPSSALTNIDDFELTDSWLYNQRAHSGIDNGASEICQLSDGRIGCDENGAPDMGKDYLYYPSEPSNRRESFNWCTHSDGIQIYSGYDLNDLTIKRTIIGPNFMHALLLGESGGDDNKDTVARVNNLFLEDVILTRYMFASVAMKKGEADAGGENWNLNRVTLYGHFNNTNKSNLAITSAKNSNEIDHTIKNTVMVHGPTSLKRENIDFGNNNCEFGLYNGTLNGHKVDPGFAYTDSNDVFAAHDVDFATVFLDDYTTSASQCSSAGSHVHSVQELLDISGPDPTPGPTGTPNPTGTPSPTATPANPGSSDVIYGDALSSEWGLDEDDSRTNESFTEASIVQSGTYAIKAEVTENWGGLHLSRVENNVVQVNEISNYESLSFWIYADHHMQLKLRNRFDGSVDTPLSMKSLNGGVNLPVNVWTYIEVDLSDSSNLGKDTFTDLIWMGYGSDHNRPTFYLDQIEIVASGDDPQPTSTPIYTPTSVGPTATPPNPGSSGLIYGDALASDWAMDYDDSRTNESFTESGIVQSGNYAIKADVVTDWGGFYLNPADGDVHQVSSYDKLRFWIYTDSRMQLKLRDDNDVSGDLGLEFQKFNSDLALPVNEWTFVEVDFSQYTALGKDTFTHLIWMGYGVKQPTFYLDQIEIVASGDDPQPTSTPVYTPTAVEPTATPANPGSSGLIYGDALASDWAMAYDDSRTNESFTESGIVQSGSYAIKADVVTDWGGFHLNPADGAVHQVSSYDKLRFWIYTDSRMQLKLRDDNDVSGDLGLEFQKFNSDLALPVNEWTFVEVDFSQYTALGKDTFTHLIWMGYGVKQPTFYLDQIEIVASGDNPQPTVIPTHTPIPTLTPEGSADLPIFTSAYHPDWETGSDNRTEVTYSADPAMTGPSANVLKVEVAQNWGHLNIVSTAGSVPITTDSKLGFWIYTESALTSAGAQQPASEVPRLKVKLSKPRDGGGYHYSGNIELKKAYSNNRIPLQQWTYFELDLGDFSGDLGEFSRISWQGVGANSTRPIFYLHDIVLINSSSASNDVVRMAITQSMIPQDNSKSGGRVLADTDPTFIGPLEAPQSLPQQTAYTVTVRKTYLLGSQPIAQGSYSYSLATGASANTQRPLTSGRSTVERLHLYTDHLGSANTTLNMATGEIKDTRFYPFGELRTGSVGEALAATGRGFTGHRENRDIGLTYMNARFYVPGAGRFASADTIVPDPVNPQAWNRYSYVFNNPINLVDLDGHDPTPPQILPFSLSVSPANFLTGIVELSFYNDLLQDESDRIRDAYRESGISTGTVVFGLIGYALAREPGALIGAAFGAFAGYIVGDLVADTLPEIYLADEVGIFSSIFEEKAGTGKTPTRLIYDDATGAILYESQNGLRNEVTNVLIEGDISSYYGIFGDIQNNYAISVIVELADGTQVTIVNEMGVHEDAFYTITSAFEGETQNE